MAWLRRALRELVGLSGFGWRHGRRILADRRGSVALLVAVALPAMAIFAGIGVEVSQWALGQARLQRAADAAAVAGALYYTGNADAQKAAGVAADIAEVNGAAGSTRSWNAGTKTLSDGNVTVVVGSGIGNANAVSINVTVTKTATSTLTGALNVGNRTLTATASADATPSTLTGEACVIILDTGSPLTHAGISDSGSTGQLLSCALRVNTGINLSGAAAITASYVYASGTISMSGTTSITATTVAGTISKSSSATITGTIVAPSAPMADPYLNSTALNSALAQLSNGSASALNIGGVTNRTLSPGIWSSWLIGNSAVVTLNPGLYVVVGTIGISGAARVTGNGVTIVHGDSFTISGSAVVNLTAPGATPTGSAVPSVVLASRTAPSVGFSGGAAFPLNGVAYYPSSAVSMSGSITASGASGCAALIAKTFSISGAVQFAVQGCSAMGAPSLATGTAGTGKLKK